MLPERVLEILAFDLGLVIISGWFLILLFMFREFRKVSNSVKDITSLKGQDEHLPIYQQSVDDALDSVNKHTATLNELTSVHEILENQLKLMHENQVENHQDDSKIIELEAQLDKSHALIKKLKGELVTSKKRLEHTKKKLYQQYDTVDNLRKENEQFLLDQQQQLEAMEESQVLVDKITKYESQQRQLVEAANDYKGKLAKQGKELDYLKQKNKQLSSVPGAAKAEVLNKKVKQLEQKLKESDSTRVHIIKEKDFIESKYLDSIKQLEELKKK